MEKSFGEKIKLTAEFGLNYTTMVLFEIPFILNCKGKDFYNSVDLEKYKVWGFEYLDKAIVVSRLPKQGF